ncbi:unnamed protein product [Chrysoparadoxa australica]
MAIVGVLRHLWHPMRVEGLRHGQLRHLLIIITNSKSASSRSKKKAKLRNL